MSRTTYRGYLRQFGTSNFSSTATPAVGVFALQFTLSDPTAASAGMGVYLPKGARVIGVQNLSGGATGGTNPTIDVGTSADADGFADELDADAVTVISGTGAQIGDELTADTEVYAGVGGSAATGGSVAVAVYYIMADDGSKGSGT